MMRFLFVVVLSLLFSSCSPAQPQSPSTQIPVQQLLSTPTEISEEVIVATEQARAAAVHTQVALTVAAQPTFTPWPTFTATSASLPTFTPIANSTPAQMGAYFDVPSDVLGPHYKIENACYFDTQSGWERHEIYAGTVAGSGDEYSAQGVVVVRIFRIREQDGKAHIELADTREYLTLSKDGPLRLPQADYGNSCYDDWVPLRTPLDFIWIFNPWSEEFYQDFHTPPLARMAIGEKMQIAERGSFCWKGGCADGPAISTASIPLVMASPGVMHLYLPLQEPPDALSLSAMFVSPPGVLKYDYQYGDSAEWSYEKPGRESIDLGVLPLQREQDIELSLKPGFYALTVVAVWHDFGDVRYGFLIEVQD